LLEIQGAANQTPPAYLRSLLGEEYKNYPQVEHVHFHGFYIRDYPSLEPEKIDAICQVLNTL